MNEERCKRLESRQRATDERVTALVEALHAYHKPDASLNNFRELVDHLAALRAPGEGAHPRNEGPGGCVPWEEAEEMRASLGEYTEVRAAADHARYVLGNGTDSMLELTYQEKKRIHNLKYYTWVEQQGKTSAELR